MNFKEQIWKKYDLIVANPPYVRESEKIEMKSNVLHYEPEAALFVPNSDPLLFYRKIGEFGQQYLNQNGKLFVEINEHLGKETKKLLEDMGFISVELKKDISGKPRMVRAVLTR